MPQALLRILFLVAVVAPVTAPAAPPVEVMILGTYHLANPGQDVHNAEIADVTSDRYQRQLAAVSNDLAAFAPTRVAVEVGSERDDLSLPAYERFTPADLREARSEHLQIGYRLASALDHEAVYGVDERSEDIDYFPFDAVRRYADEVEGSERLADLNAQAAAYVKQQEQLHAERGVAATLAWMNRPGMIERMHHNWYYGLLELADAERQPGALLNGRYYLRNARIFARIAAISEPGDRVLVVFGAGHAYWLRHLVTETPGFELVEPNLYLTPEA
jgi:hypothetical protein